MTVVWACELQQEVRGNKIPKNEKLELRHASTVHLRGAILGLIKQPDTIAQLSSQARDACLAVAKPRAGLRGGPAPMLEPFQDLVLVDLLLCVFQRFILCCDVYRNYC